MSRRGFTLMEMLVALAIVAMLMGGSMVAMGSLNDEKILRRPLNDVRSLAKRAWMRSMQEQRAWQIRVVNDRFVLEPKQPLLAQDIALFKEVDQQLGRGSGIETVMIPEEVKVEVRHWGEEKWHPPVPDLWVFEQSGLSEPINLRFSSAFGIITVSFDPLTAAVETETFEVAP